MSGLNKPTIEGLIEKLLSDNYIKPDEAETVQSEPILNGEENIN